MLGITHFANKASSWKTTVAGIVDSIGSIGLYGQLISDVVQIANHAESISTNPGVLIISAVVKILAKLAGSYYARDNNVSSRDLKIK
jgi:hypothetical protein